MAQKLSAKWAKDIEQRVTHDLAAIPPDETLDTLVRFRAFLEMVQREQQSASPPIKKHAQAIRQLLQNMALEPRGQR